MTTEATTPSETRWFIDLNWLKTNKRSFSTVAGAKLCTKCRKKLKAETGELKPAELLKAIQICCSKNNDFITPGMAFQESIFRVFLANGNKPMTLEELGQQLVQRRGADTSRTTVAFLSRLMQNDNYYGIKAK
jgi:hypothetical protein